MKLTLLAKPHEGAVFKSLQHSIFVYFREEICSKEESTIVGFGRAEFSTLPATAFNVTQLSHWGKGVMIHLLTAGVRGSLND